MIKIKILDCLKKVIKEKIEIEVFVSEQEQFGHYSSNVAMKLATLARNRRGTLRGTDAEKSPLKIAENLRSEILNLRSDLFTKIEIAPPGFINFWLSEKTLQNELKEILKRKEKYGKFKLQITNYKLQIEFISANPTGPLTLANGRGGFLGDVLSNILEFCGYKIEREYYINDTGNQILTLGKSVLANAGFISFEEKFYKGEYVKEWANKNSTKIKRYKDNPMKIGQMAAQSFLKEIKSAIGKAGIKFNRWTSEERNIHKKNFIEKSLNIFKKAGLAYEQDGALWLKTTNFGDEKDRVLITSDGFPTYFLADAGHFLETKTRGFNKKIMILGPDHHGYAKRIKIAGEIVGLKESKIIITQAVRLMSKGQEIKMSKRTGEFVLFEDLLKEAKPDAARFFFLMHSADSHMDFDLDLAKEQSMKNPVYYAQYAAVRCGSILRKSEIQNPKSETNSKSKIQNLNLLNTKEDLNLMMMLARFSEIIEEAARNYNPSVLARYAIDLARQFHNFYEKERVIGEDIDKNLSLARLELIKATQIVFENLFSLLGISMPKKM